VEIAASIVSVLYESAQVKSANKMTGTGLKAPIGSRLLASNALGA
jgi:hypothetical protein